MDSRRWQQIQSAFDTLVELEASERGSRLTALSSSDPELRAAVESLLAADREADARLAPLDATFVAQPVATADPLGITGCAISHFQVHESIGAGGMGIVYRAEDTRLGRPVALKFLLPSYSLDAAATSRFLREAHTAAALDHPNLCTVHEVGCTDNGRLFLAMALYPGETLKARLARDEPLPVRQALDIARQIAEGLEGAHASGIVHRDLKPGNVMLLPDGTVRILDFGLAKARDQSVTATGARFGTVSYMAPEQMRGNAVDGRADLWALGVVLYEMLTRRKPFERDEEVAIAHAILHDEPVPPSAHRGDVSAALDDLVLQLMQKDPARRYVAVDDVLRDLARIGSASEGTIVKLRTRWRRVRRRAPLAVQRTVAVCALLLVSGAFAYTAVARSRGNGALAAARTAIAVLPFRNLSAGGPNAYFAAGLHDEILTQLYKVPAIKVIGRSSVMAYSGPNAPPLRQIARELEVGSVVEGSVQVIGNRVRVNVQLMDAANEAPLWVERYDRTLDDAFAIESEIAQQIMATVGAALSNAERNTLTTVPTAKAEAYLLYLQGREYQLRPGLVRENFATAQERYERALALDPDFALARAALSRVHGYMYWLRYDMTPARLAQQRAEGEAALRLAPTLPQGHVSMSHVYAVGPADSRRALEELRIAARAAPNDPDIWRWIAQAHRRLGEWDQFVAPFEKAVQLDPRNADLLWDQGGGTYRRMGRYAEAVQWYNRALSISPGLTGAALAKAWVYVAWKGQLDTLRFVLDGLPANVSLGEGQSLAFHHARRLLLERKPDSLLQLLRAARGSVFQSVTDFYPPALYAGWAHQLRGDHTAARASFDSALVFLHSAILQFPDDWPVHSARGLALAGLGRRDEALREVRWLHECLIYRQDAFLRPSVASSAAKILAQLGETDAALSAIERALGERPSGWGPHFLRLDPLWDPIREHPRFRAVLARYAS